MFYDFSLEGQKGIANVVSPDGARISNVISAQRQWNYTVRGMAGLPTTVFDRTNRTLVSLLVRNPTLLAQEEMK